MLKLQKDTVFYEYNDLQTAMSDLEKQFPIPKNHRKKAKDLEIQRSTEVYVFRKFLETKDIVISYPIKVKHCGDQEGFPDILFVSNGEQYFVEVTAITDQFAQLIYQSGKTVELPVTGSLDITPRVKERVDAKNKNVARYKEKTGIQNSILLLYYNDADVFSFGSPGDEFWPDQIKSNFGHTFLFFNPTLGGIEYLKI